MNMLKNKFSAVHEIAAKKAIKQFASKFKFVYFGKIDQHGSDQKFVRGVTASVNHADDYCVMGSFKGRDIIIVQRQNTLSFAGSQPQLYKWQIMQIDLNRSDMPHVFIDGNHYEKAFYSDFFAKHSSYENAAGLFTFDDPLFLKHFKVFAGQNSMRAVRNTLTPEITAMLAHHFKQFDYEINGDSLMVYATNAVATLKLLQEMMRIGVWLADSLDTPDLR